MKPGTTKTKENAMKTVYTNYGPCRAGQSYRVIREGSDYTVLSVQGKPVNVPLYIFQYVPPQKDENDV